MQVLAITPEDLVAARVYPDKQSVLHDALRYLSQNRPDARIDVAVYRYEHDYDLSLAKAASLAGVSFERMKEILSSRGVPLRLGPETPEEARREVEAMERWLHEDTDYVMCNFHIQEPTPCPSQEGNASVADDEFPSWEG